jgi:hypothetical protein
MHSCTMKERREPTHTHTHKLLVDSMQDVHFYLNSIFDILKSINCLTVTHTFFKCIHKFETENKCNFVHIPVKNYIKVLNELQNLHFRNWFLFCYRDLCLTFVLIEWHENGNSSVYHCPVHEKYNKKRYLYIYTKVCNGNMMRTNLITTLNDFAILIFYIIVKILYPKTKYKQNEQCRSHLGHNIVW